MAGHDAADGAPFGRYRLVELLGRGGMGEVWRAYDTETDRVVAIKLLPPHCADKEDFERRFRREAYVAARLNTPHVVPIHNYGEIDGRLYVDMRLIEGRDLQTVLADGQVEPSRAVRIIEGVALGLHAGHEVGLLHRDVKPSNILLDKNDFAYLIDFGIARAMDETRMTKSGNTIGTFAYIAPERLDGRGEEDARADIYSLACVLYECLTGEPPFAGDTMARLMYAHVNNPPPRPSTTQPEVPAQFDAVIATGMAKDPDQRYATTIELADAARDAVTEPIARPTLPATEQATLPATEQAPNRFPAQPMTLKAESPASATPAPPPQPPPPAPTRAGRLSRGTTIALIGGVIALVAVIAAAVGISALVKHAPSGSSPKSSAGSYAAQMVLPFTGRNLKFPLNLPAGIAVDASGAVYTVECGLSRVLKLAADSSTPTELPFTDTDCAIGVAVDTAGDLYVTDSGHHRVLKLAAGSSTPIELSFTGLKSPKGVAVDTTGSLYVTDCDNVDEVDYAHQVLKLAADSSTPILLPFDGLNCPEGVTVDSAGTLYVTDGGNHRVLKLAAGSSTQTVLPFTGLEYPQGVAVDRTGTLYVADAAKLQVLKLTPDSAMPTVLPFTGLNGPDYVAVDTAGDVYITDSGPSGGITNRVLKLPAQ